MTATKTARTSTTKTAKVTKTVSAALKAWVTRRKADKASGHNAALKAWETIRANREAAALAEAKAARAARKTAKKS